MYRRHLGWAPAVGTAVVLALAFPIPASAKKFQMSGTWLMRKGQAIIPLLGTVPAASHVSMGNLTEVAMTPLGALAKPQQLISDVGVVTTTGVVPQTLIIPKHRFVDNFMTVDGLTGTMLIQITTMFGIDAPFSTASLMAGGGPGPLTWCPSNPACVATGLPPGPVGNNGRVRYVSPGLQYGGTMQMGLINGGLVSVKNVGIPPSWALHLPFGGSGPTVRQLAVGGMQLGSNTPVTEMVNLNQGTVTVPPNFPASGSIILTPGPILFMTPGIMTPLGGTAGQFTTNWAFGHTTGTVIVQQVTGTGGNDFFAVMGSDNRTAMGAGNITTVAGGLAQRNTAGGATHYAQWDKVWMELAFPTPSMSPAGFAAAGVLMLLAVGYAMRRRLP